MLYQIVSLLLEVVTGLLTGLCLLRLYLQYQRIPMSARSGNPLGPFLFTTTDWLVLPLRRVVPALGRWDLGSLVGGLVVQLAAYALEWALLGAVANWLSIVVLAVFGVARTAISMASGLVIVYAVLSWVQTHTPLSDLLERMVYPLLAPIRRVVPLLGGVDLSPLVLLILLQIATIVVGTLQTTALTALL